MKSAPFRYRPTPGKERSIHELACAIRKRLNQEDVGEASFAKGLLYLDHLAQGQAQKIIQVLNRDDTGPALAELLLCWLDGKGFGAITYEDLAASATFD